MNIDGCLSDSFQEDKMSSGNSSLSESQGGGLKHLAMQLAKVIHKAYSVDNRERVWSLEYLK